MSEVIHFIEKYQSQTPEDIISLSDLENDIRKISQEQQSVDTKAEAEVRLLLKKILKALENRLMTLGAEMKQQKEKISCAQQNLKACVAYLHTAKGAKK